MKIAIVGGGLFGCTAAIHAARAGHEVHLHEKSGGIMRAASAANQFRLHRGYHYPRSKETGRQCRNGNESFMREYGRCVITPSKRSNQYYCIAREGSNVTPDQYLAFLNSSDLPYRKVPPPPMMVDNVALCVTVLENMIEPLRLVDDVARKLGEAGVDVHLESPATRRMRDEYDRIVVAAYAGTNEVIQALECAPNVNKNVYQYELVEKPVIRLPSYARDTGVVIMDGPFCCVDPYGWSNDHVMGHVEQAIWHRSIGALPECPEHLAAYVDKGLIAKPDHSRFRDMVASGVEYLPCLREAEHVGSLYTQRTVLPDNDATDARPTLVERLDPQIIRIFSGKLGCAVDAAAHAVFMMET